MRQSFIQASLMMLFALCLKGYWQQEVHYNIAVTLNDTANSLTATEQLLYINHSPDTLTGIWMHLWPNAYRNDLTALARERMKSKKTRFLETKEEKRGWMDLGDVTSNGQPVTWHTRGDSIDMAWFDLPEPLLPGDSVRFDIPFTVQIPQLTSRMGHIGQHYEITQWYPKPAVYDATGWHPIPYRNWGEFYSEWGGFTVAITLPENYVVAATGIIQTPSERLWLDSLAMFGNSLLDSMNFGVVENTNENGPIKPAKKIRHDEPDTLRALIKTQKRESSPTFKTIIFRQDRVHDFAWFADKQFVVTHTTTQIDSNRAPIDLWNFVLPKNFATYKGSLKTLKTAIDSCSAWFMPYPYDQCSVVDGDISAGGGMEYPMITVINAINFPGVMDLTIFHEVAHNWFYGLAGFNERDFPWLDEGFTTYAEKRHTLDSSTTDGSWISKHLSFLNEELMYDAPFYARIIANLDEPANLPADQFDESNYRGMIYDKPSAVAMMLQDRVGNVRMDRMWHQFFREWAFKHPQPADVRQVFEQNLGMNLDWYFDELIGSIHKMDYGISRVKSNPANAEWTTSFKLTNHGELTAPVPVEISGADRQSKTVWLDDVRDSRVFSIVTPFKPGKVILDPKGVTLDMNRVNDGTGVRLKFLVTEDFLNRGHGYTIRWLPGAWWNAQDGILPAFWLMHRGLDDPIQQWRYSVQYGTITKSWYQSLQATRKFYIPGITQSELNARATLNWCAPLAGVKTTLLWRDVPNSHQTKLTAGLLYQDIREKAITQKFLDDRVWQSVLITKGSITAHHERNENDRNWATDFSVVLGFQSPNVNGVNPSVSRTISQTDDQPFTRWEASISVKSKLTSRLALKWNLFTAAVLGSPPSQELIYLSSGVDPNLESPALLTHTSSHWLSPNNGLFIETNSNIPGYGLQRSDKNSPSARQLVGSNLAIDLGMPMSFLIAGGIRKITETSDWETVGSFSPCLKWNRLPLEMVFPVVWFENGKMTSGFQVQANFAKHFSFRLGG